MNVSRPLVWANLGRLVVLLAAEQVTKLAGVYPLARRHVPADAMFTMLLMSTGLTFGTISSLYGLNAGILDRGQFSVLVAVVVASAVIPTVTAQRWFSPREEPGSTSWPPRAWLTSGPGTFPLPRPPRQQNDGPYPPPGGLDPSTRLQPTGDAGCRRFCICQR